MTKVIGRRRRIAITTAVLLAVGGGAAFAYWSAMGNGTGATSAGTSTSFTVTTTAATGGPLTPGGPAQTVAFTVTNPGTGSQNLAAVSVTVAKSDGTTWDTVSGCTAADFTVGTPTFTPGEIAASGIKTGTVTVSMINRAQNQDACKNVTVPLYIAAS
ncbi:hypothetical protein E5206_06245 [Arthrobacter sp. PAMC25564]|uniref:hypothetical protein n=1 Tax=Arthrobacter sp. PAMC25564 TaxID=2565366 RepID=UPI0010A29961|nr:hypothetical protein [Arthrobacter sp. PAMC25564]QCB96576.1 hypothetical protein E5206_06245 [Arthrobacter sp. PAMC25564]